jgi:DNA polymerase III subunit delta'
MTAARAPLRGPMPWHAGDLDRLLSGAFSGRLHHALLLSGPSGIGKRLLAERLGRALLCETPIAAGECGQCKACRLMVAGTHPDLLRISPEEPGKQIRIAQVREELVDFVVRTASIALRKVVLIEPAEAMNLATANCLLKSLEEPSPDTFLLLLSDAPVRLLPTIRSRCRQVPLRPPALAEGLAWLVAQRGASGAEDLLGVAAGRPLEALRLDEADALGQFDRAVGLLQRAAHDDAWISRLAEEVSDIDVRELLGWMQVYLVDLARWLADASASRLPRARAVHAALRPHTSAHTVAAFLRETLRASRDAASTANPNRQLLLESLLHAWSLAHRPG